MVVEHWVQSDGGEIIIFLHCIKKVVDNDGLMTWKLLQKVTDPQNARHQGDKIDNDTLITLYEDFFRGTYNEEPRNTWWKVLRQHGMISPHESSKVISSLFELSQWWGTDKSPIGFTGTRNEKSSFRATETSSQCPRELTTTRP